MKKRADGVVENGRDEEVGISVYGCETTFFLHYALKTVQGPGILPVPWIDRLNYQSGSDEIKWGEENARQEV